MLKLNAYKTPVVINDRPALCNVLDTLYGTGHYVIWMLLTHDGILNKTMWGAEETEK